MYENESYTLSVEVLCGDGEITSFDVVKGSHEEVVASSKLNYKQVKQIVDEDTDHANDEPVMPIEFFNLQIADHEDGLIPQDVGFTLLGCLVSNPDTFAYEFTETSKNTGLIKVDVSNLEAA